MRVVHITVQPFLRDVMFHTEHRMEWKTKQRAYMHSRPAVPHGDVLLLIPNPSASFSCGGIR